MLNYYKLNLSKLTKIVNKKNNKLNNNLNITVLRNITVEPIKIYLQYLGLKSGYNTVLNFGNFDNIFQDVMGTTGENIINKKTDIILIFCYLPILSPIIDSFIGYKKKTIYNEYERILEYAYNIIENIKKKSNAFILWHSFENKVYPSLGVADQNKSGGQNKLISKLNNEIKSILLKKKTGHLVDLNLCLSRIGYKNYYDKRYWYIGKAPYTREAYREIAFEDFKYIRAVKGKNKKCLILDCDNILWGGIVGEDGLEGIKLSEKFSGNVYIEFQKIILNLYNRGIILALCSKNNEKDVWEVFEKHPDMILKKEHIAAYRINWKNKASNIKEIVEELNIGFDSVVFIDDNQFEIGLVKEKLSEVTTLHFSEEEYIYNSDKLISCGLFDSLNLSKEDRKRTKMYKNEVERKKLFKKIGNLNEYLKSLKMVVEIKFADKFAFPRITQLTKRTNQFNLTTKRYSESEILKFMNSEKYDVVYCKVEDRIGKYGIVGVAIIEYKENKAIIDSFLLSCRILGRKVENLFLRQILLLAKNKDKKIVIGKYIPSKKNQQTKDFYLKNGFKKINDNKNKGYNSEFDLLKYKPLKNDPIFKKIDSEINLNDH